jgi:hypothetical protein
MAVPEDRLASGFEGLRDVIVIPVRKIRSNPPMNAPSPVNASPQPKIIQSAKTTAAAAKL